MNLQKQKATDLVRRGISLCLAGAASQPGNYDSGNAHTISTTEVNDGVVALLLATGIRHGSAGDVDLYKLNQRYLQDRYFRERVNALLDRKLYEMEMTQCRFTNLKF